MLIFSFFWQIPRKKEGYLHKKGGLVISSILHCIPWIYWGSCWGPPSYVTVCVGSFIVHYMKTLCVLVSSVCLFTVLGRAMVSDLCPFYSKINLTTFGINQCVFSTFPPFLSHSFFFRSLSPSLGKRVRSHGRSDGLFSMEKNSNTLSTKTTKYDTTHTSWITVTQLLNLMCSFSLTVYRNQMLEIILIFKLW